MGSEDTVLISFCNTGGWGTHNNSTHHEIIHTKTSGGSREFWCHPKAKHKNSQRIKKNSHYYDTLGPIPWDNTACGFGEFLSGCAVRIVRTVWNIVEGQDLLKASRVVQFWLIQVVILAPNSTLLQMQAVSLSEHVEFKVCCSMQRSYFHQNCPSNKMTTTYTACGWLSRLCESESNLQAYYE
jgi:hypothetical protein